MKNANNTKKVNENRAQGFTVQNSRVDQELSEKLQERAGKCLDIGQLLLPIKDLGTGRNLIAYRCSWCAASLGFAWTNYASGISHGMCHACAEATLQALESI